MLNYHLPTIGLGHGLHSSPLCAWTGFACHVLRHEIASIYALFEAALSALSSLPLRSGLSLFQNCDLAGVVELVLRDSVQHVVEIVALAGDTIT